MSASTPSLEEYAKAHRRRALRRVADDAAFRDALTSKLAPLVELLARDFSARRIVLFGSLARGDAVRGSDIDLLVDGIRDERLFEAMAAASRITGVDVDLVPVSCARPFVLSRAAEEGVVLHDSG